jgi:menaquinone-9 beta-reductase
MGQSHRMADERFDALVVGAGPAGSVCALVLARGGARVALVDKASFPRDKACGDLVGPRGVRLLEDLGLDVSINANGGNGGGHGDDVVSLGDMLVVGPTGDRVRLPSAAGLTYPGHAWAIPRLRLDEALWSTAVEAGALPFTGRAEKPLWNEEGLCGFELEDSTRIRADFVVGADGATSRVAEVAGLLEPALVLWGFAVRFYVDHHVQLPTILIWEPEPRRALRGYGWIFPGSDGRANAGLGVGTLSDRRNGAEPVRLLPRFVEHLSDLGLLDARAEREPRRLGGWLKLGILGTRPARGGVLLVGDAAGLVNPLQGEGIAHAMTSGRAAAEAILETPGEAARRYVQAIADAHLPYHRITSTAHAALLGRPGAVSALSRLLTSPKVGPHLAEGWALFWNELLDGAPRGRAHRQAAVATSLGAAATFFARSARWFESTFSAGQA